MREREARLEAIRKVLDRERVDSQQTLARKLLERGFAVTQATLSRDLKNLGVAREFRERFEAEMGEIGCRELTGLDLTSEQDMAELMNSDIPKKVCFPAVATAYRLAVELLRETE